MKLPPPLIVDASPPDANGIIAQLTTAAGVFCVEAQGRVTHLSSAPNLQRRVGRTVEKFARFLNAAEPKGGRPSTLRIQCWPTRSKLESALLIYQLARQHFPSDYLKRIHLRMPWFVGLLTRDPFPRLISSNRVPSGCEPVIGPFARRDLALLYESEVQSAFLLRRCTETLDPHPQHPGCMYGEMKQCLRPCQCAVDTSRYLTEAGNVSAVLRDPGGHTLHHLTKSRDAAVTALDFETAARLHKQLERLQTARAARDPVITDIHNFTGVAVTLANEASPAVSGQASVWVQLFPLLQGRWLEPLIVDGHANAKALQEQLEPHLATIVEQAGLDSRHMLENLALFARWYYSSWREGSWISFVKIDELPYRKLARAVQKLVKATEQRQPKPALQGEPPL